MNDVPFIIENGLSIYTIMVTVSILVVFGLAIHDYINDKRKKK